MNRKPFLLIILFCILKSSVLHSQQCEIGTITAYSQEELDSLMQPYINCTEIKGSIRLFGSVNNIQVLNNIKKIDGDLFTFNPAIENLSPLNNLETVSGDLWLYSWDHLNNIDGLTSLKSVGDDFFLLAPMVLNIDGLTKLKSVGGDLYCVYSNLQNLSGFEKIETIGGTLHVTNNTNLINLEGLNSIKTLGSLFLKNNYNLTSLYGLQDIKELDHVRLIEQQNIINFDGLNSVKKINGSLQVWYCPEFNSFDGLEKLKSLNSLLIYENPSIQSISAGIYNHGLKSLKELHSFDAGNNIQLTSISGFNNIGSKMDNFSIFGNDALTSLSGFEKVDTIYGLSLTGVQDNSLNAFNDVKKIEYLFAQVNNFQSYSGFQNLNAINYIYIYGHPNLSSLAGFENINPNELYDLYLEYNPQLDVCSIPPICDYLSDPNSSAYFNDNGASCNSRSIVEDNCNNSNSVINGDYREYSLMQLEDNQINELNFVNNDYIIQDLFMYPNPTFGELKISDKNLIGAPFTIYNLKNETIFTDVMKETVDVSKLSPGIYIISVIVDDKNRSIPFVKQ